jgi:hypothetical protein
MLQYGEGWKIEIFCFQICRNVNKGEIMKYTYNISVGKLEGR